MRIQLWSYNYDPEPTGIGIVSAISCVSEPSRTTEYGSYYRYAHPYVARPSKRDEKAERWALATDAP